MTNKPHPHADVLRAIADGAPLSEFEVTSNERCWLNVKDAKMTDWFFSDPQQWLVRRKQRTHVVNGFTVPAPMDKEPSNGDSYFAMSPYVSAYYSENLWSGFQCEKLWLKRGIVHATKEAAIANAKAMLKIDPEAA